MEVLWNAPVPNIFITNNIPQDTLVYSLEFRFTKFLLKSFKLKMGYEYQARRVKVSMKVGDEASLSQDGKYFYIIEKASYLSS